MPPISLNIDGEARKRKLRAGSLLRVVVRGFCENVGSAPSLLGSAHRDHEKALRNGLESQSTALHCAVCVALQHICVALRCVALRSVASHCIA